MRQRSTIQIIFPILLFCVFAVSAILVVTLGARVYSSTVKSSEKNYSARTSLSYITEKIHQNDSSGVISVSQDTLVLSRDNYSTSIYVYEGNLCELTAEKGADLPPDSGTILMPLKELSIERVNRHLLSITCTEEDGTARRALVSVHSAAGA